MVTLENERFIVTAKEEGAELTRINDKEHRRECLWNGDPAIWKGQAPILFPVVGRCKNYQYRYQGKTYEIGQHGFCRQSVFEIADQTKTQVVFRLKASEETKKAYPFDFVLSVIYTLEAEQIITTFRVENPAEHALYFSIGGHPGFFYDGPIEKQVVSFDVKESLDRVLLSENGQFRREVEKEYIKKGEDLHLYEGIFKDDALVFHDFAFHKLRIQNPETGRGVEMDLSGFPYVGIWSMNKPGSPYACIEPWYGLADYEDFAGELPEKDGIQKLEGGAVFECCYAVKML